MPAFLWAIESLGDREINISEAYDPGGDQSGGKEDCDVAGASSHASADFLNLVLRTSESV